ncbi:MAG: hypothetical protein F6K00_12505 [Leptolyngbya sp. SIOISBB]|nr:hypothetical protein [Leptolyngbya sp. SIOISBB]
MAGSETVQQLYEAQGKQHAMKFAAHIVQIAGKSKVRRSQETGKKRQFDLEMGD